MSLVHEKQIKVTEEHIDQNNHVNNVQYVHWVEEVAAEHWDLLKHKTEYENDVWMLLDHHIRYKKQVYLNDVITVKTYPQTPEGAKQPRKVEFYCHDELVVDSSTLWILFDTEAKKIKRLENNWLEKLEKQIEE
ncbi:MULTISPECIES: acyl-CoA thioesterase [unclassified Chryseobacterium]|uniref:acyl-CoA thioesterase n=1 Tax=unclassified Chryseobacterium TaxID=2593645 RepID=UPI00100A6350|nr:MULTISPECIES: acyl-ACP thioesterase domain-containing protein [unclassified Chryseobacterium]RXM52755.1 thioesterase [Chryseobacterium sp. CH25]RXM66810.1 thioesterase [Chryseobacterium sp. CH1]